MLDSSPFTPFLINPRQIVLIQHWFAPFDQILGLLNDQQLLFCSLLFNRETSLPGGIVRGSLRSPFPSLFSTGKGRGYKVRVSQFPIRLYSHYNTKTDTSAADIWVAAIVTVCGT